MIRLDNTIQPSANALANLALWQSAITGTFEERSTKAKTIFSNKNKRTNPTFREVKVALTLMCSGNRRCVYCEDSLGDQVEHIHPKDIYPDRTFDWENYVYACGPCNGPKNNKFAIFRAEDGAFVHVNPVIGEPPQAPPAGDPVLINPRIEDPLQFAMLDLKGTFNFVAMPGLDDRSKLRFEYTFNTILCMNDPEREVLAEGRRTAFGSYRARLVEYDDCKQENSPGSHLETLVSNLKKQGQPTVWKEMQRYYRYGWLGKVDERLKVLFDRNPEALGW